MPIQGRARISASIISLSSGALLESNVPQIGRLQRRKYAYTKGIREQRPSTLERISLHRVPPSHKIARPKFFARPRIDHDHPASRGQRPTQLPQLPAPRRRHQLPATRRDASRALRPGVRQGGPVAAGLGGAFDHHRLRQRAGAVAGANGVVEAGRSPAQRYGDAEDGAAATLVRGCA